MFELLLEPDPKLVLSLMNENTERTLTIQLEHYM